MKVKVNGDELALPDGATLHDLLVKLDLGDARVAAELNHVIIPRSRHGQQPLQDGDQIEIVHAIGGG